MAEPEPEWLPWLIREHALHQAAIERFDGQRLQVRTWAITVTGAVLAAAFGAKVPLLTVGGVFSTVLFAFLESIYLSIGTQVALRSNELERLVNAWRSTGSLPEPYQFGVGQAYRTAPGLRGTVSALFRPGRLHVSVFYLTLLVVSLLAVATAF